MTTPDEWARLYVERRDRHLHYYDGLACYWNNVIGGSIYDLPWPSPEDVREAAARGRTTVLGPYNPESPWRVRIGLHPGPWIEVEPTKEHR